VNQVAEKHKIATFFEWRKVDGKNDYCVLHEHFVLEEGHPGSVSGLNFCENFQELFEEEENSCFLMDTRPFLRKMKTEKMGSQTECAAECQTAGNCEAWELQKTSGTCHLYRVAFNKNTNSHSGPVKCSQSVK